MNLETLKVVITADASGFNKTIKGVKSQLSGLNSAVDKATGGIQESLNSISRKVSFAAVTAGFAALTRSAIRAASDLQEVQNVVDNAFGKADKDIETFAKNAIYQFGISEYAAKKYSSTLMAMGVSMGVAADKSKIMSIQLTGLASDLASFYNTDVETAFNALQSIYTGTVRPLRQYGIALSENALQEYANAKGINKKVSAMNAAEKATLRYNYVLENTALAQGDFARTNMSWHNSLQTISNQLNNLAVIVGTILMRAFEPLVAMLSTIVSYAVKAAQSLAAMFGINLQFSSETSGVADAWDDATEATEDATGAAKKYKKLIAGFDELNILSSTGGGSTAGIGSGGFDVGSYFDITEGKEKLLDFNKWLKDIDEWLVNAEKTFEELGIKLGNKFNNLINYLDWALIGKTIIDGLNDIFITINTFFDRARFINLGNKIAKMVNSALETIKPEEWGQILVNKLNAMWETAFGFVSNLDWKLLGQRIQEIVIVALDKINIDAISGTIVKTFNGITTIILEWADGFPIVELGAKLWEAIEKTIEGIDAYSLGAALNKLITQVFESLRNIDYSKITKALAEFFEALDIVGLFKEYIATKVELISEALSGLFSTKSGAAVGIVGILATIGSAITNLAAGPLGQLNTQILLAINVSSKLRSVLTHLLNPFGMFSKKVDEAGTVLEDSFIDTMKVSGWSLKEFSSALKGAFGNLATGIKGVFGKLITSIKGLLSYITPTVAIVAALVASFIDAYTHSEKLRATIAELGNVLGTIFTFIKDTVLEVYNQYLKPIITSIIDLIKAIQTVLTPLWEIIFNIIGAIADIAVPRLLTMASILKGPVYLALDIVKNAIVFFEKVIEAAILLIGKFIQFLSDQFDKVKEAAELGRYFIEGLYQGILNAISGVYEWLKTNIYDPFINGFKSLFGINSPSTVMAELGGYMVEGLFQGISLSEFWGSIQTWFNDKLTGMKQWCSDTWTSISTTATEKWDSIKETVGTSVSKIGETISTWGQGASDNFNTIMSNIGSIIGDALGIDATNWGDGLNEILGLSGDFGKGIVDYFGDIGKSIANNLTNGANGGITALNGLVSAYKRAKAEDYASQLGAYNTQVASLKAAGVKVIPSFSPRPFPKISLPSLFSFIPRLASGGVITSETMAVMGEYPGARSNPEIVSPQNILRETIDASNSEMVGAFAQMTNQIITAIGELDMNVSIGDDVIANSASRGDKAYKKRTGKSLFAY